MMDQPPEVGLTPHRSPMQAPDLGMSHLDAETFTASCRLQLQPRFLQGHRVDTVSILLEKSNSWCYDNDNYHWS